MLATLLFASTFAGLRSMNAAQPNPGLIPIFVTFISFYFAVFTLTGRLVVSVLLTFLLFLLLLLQLWLILLPLR